VDLASELLDVIPGFFYRNTGQSGFCSCRLRYHFAVLFPGESMGCELVAKDLYLLNVLIDGKRRLIILSL
jgi:hypothetical protein